MSGTHVGALGGQPVGQLAGIGLAVFVQIDQHEVHDEADVLGRHRKRALKRRLGVRGLAELEVGHGEVVVRLRVVRVQTDRLPIRLDRAIVHALLVVNIPHVVVDLGDGRVDLERHLILFEREILLPERVVGDAEVHVHGLVIGVDGERLAVLLDRLRRLPPPRMPVPELVVDVGAVRVALARLRPDRLAVPPVHVPADRDPRVDSQDGHEDPHWRLPAPEQGGQPDAVRQGRDVEVAFRRLVHDGDDVGDRQEEQEEAEDRERFERSRAPDSPRVPKAQCDQRRGQHHFRVQWEPRRRNRIEADRQDHELDVGGNDPGRGQHGEPHTALQVLDRGLLGIVQQDEADCQVQRQNAQEPRVTHHMAPDPRRIGGPRAEQPVIGREDQRQRGGHFFG